MEDSSDYKKDTDNDPFGGIFSNDELARRSESRDDFLELHGIEKQKHNLTIYSSMIDELSEKTLEGLNIDQRNAVTKISKFLAGGYRTKYFTLYGGPGFGKSYSIVRALQGIPVDDIIAAAPSHFAKNVLQNFLGEAYKVTTIAALLGKRVTFNDKGEQVLVRIKGMPPPILKYRVILIDEGSMIHDETAYELMEYVEGARKFLIVLGDYCQLPPVKQSEDSLFFDNISAELTIPMRFTGPIFELVSTIRAEIIKIREGSIPTLNILNNATDRVSKVTETGTGYIFLKHIKFVIDAAVRRFKKGKGTQYVRILAYRNKTIDLLNDQIRKELYGAGANQFEPGELIICEGGFTHKVGRKVNALINNGELFVVKFTKDIKGPYDIPCKEMYFENKSFSQKIITVATRGRAKYDRVLKELVDKAKKNPSGWAAVYKFKESFAYFKFAYASSIHKAQGSSIAHVFIMEDDIYATRATTTKEKLQSLYVGVSRASYRVYIYNKDFPVNNKGLIKEHLILDSDEYS